LAIDESNLAIDEWNLAIDEWNLAIDEWNLTIDEWNLAIDEWNLAIDEWNLTIDEWNLAIDEWNLTIDEWNLHALDSHLFYHYLCFFLYIFRVLSNILDDKKPLLSPIPQSHSVTNGNSTPRMSTITLETN